MRPRVLLPAALALTVALCGAVVAAPTCGTGLPAAACAGRVVPEPERATSFHQFDGSLESLEASLAAIEALAPRYVEVMTLAEATGNPAHRSLGGRPLWVARVTDERAPRKGKAQVALSLSVHGQEPAGREGGLRYLEDLARWATSEPQRRLHAGDVGVPIAEVLRRTETWFGFTNSDGWAAGDVDSTEPGGFQRGNEGGADLNRDYATVGWYDHGGGRGLAESEPETRGWAALVRSFPNLKTSTDVHGELTTPNDAFADLIVPAGQWTPKRQEQVSQLAAHMIRSVERKFAEHGVVLATLLSPLPSDGRTPRRAANVAAAYDIVGYDDSGFMGDWFSQTQDSVHMDVENFLSHIAPGSAWVAPLEQAHVAAVRGMLEATIVEALLTDAVRPRASYGRVAYVGDPLRTSSSPNADDGVPGAGADVEPGERQKPYSVSRLDYFPQLRKAFGATVDQVPASAVAAGRSLAGYDTLVVADMELPWRSKVDKKRYAAALDRFVRGGGQLLLTDRALRLLDDLRVVAAADVGVKRTDAGHVDFEEPIGDHPYEKGLVGKPSQTYYEVMLGFPARGSAPNYSVARAAWEAAGGTTVATVGGTDRTALGSLPRGKGRVTVIGSLLPQAVETLVTESGAEVETPHPHGLASYAVTITGGQVLDNVLAYRR